ncbi:MAG: PEP/pyruvate-binding domain-containing protein, partial [Clostridiales Family XIII bacterium]|nr:PEP/pyruvate-binding domain-containing protein [Clostridiales Family XIII bacterium]
MINQKKAPSGLEGLDRAVGDLRYGDNIVWQISDVGEYAFFAEPFADVSIRDRKNTVYFRYGKDAPLLKPVYGLKVVELDLAGGFEMTVMQIHDVIEREGDETHYIFDSMTALQREWVADFMLSNFFAVVAPDIVKHKCVAYYAFTRNLHSIEAVARIRESAQVLLDVFHADGNMYLYPLRVTDRYHFSMFLPHKVDKDDANKIEALTNGIAISRFYSIVGASGNVDSEQRLDSWDRFFIKMQRLPDERPSGEAEDADDGRAGIRALCRMVFGADERILDIATNNVTLKDILAIKARMIGVGGIGGKATGMILSRMIVDKRLPDIAQMLEPHDSFYICSNLYYTFLIKNNCWSLKLRQRTKRGYFTVAEILKEKIMESSFSENIREQFRRMLEYYGQSPIIVRSSSLLEDGFGNAFAGKYESVFCVNVGTLEERLVAFENAVKTVYASTMDESVLAYRRSRGLAEREEQMALLVQRVSGSLFRDFYMPAAAGVAYSYNSYRWSRDIDPTQGVIRIVMGLGTRAVDRT